jgi:hypothetical protein
LDTILREILAPPLGPGTARVLPCRAGLATGQNRAGPRAAWWARTVWTTIAAAQHMKPTRRATLGAAKQWTRAARRSFYTRQSTTRPLPLKTHSFCCTRNEAGGSRWRTVRYHALQSTYVRGKEGDGQDHRTVQCGESTPIATKAAAAAALRAYTNKSTSVQYTRCTPVQQ